MKNWLFYFSFLVGAQGWAQVDTLYEEDLRKVGDKLFQNLQPSIYGDGLLNRAFTEKKITLNQIYGNYSQVHTMSDFFALYEDLTWSYLDSTNVMSIPEITQLINSEFKKNEDTNDILVQPFGFLLHNLSYIDSSNFIDSNVLINNFILTPIIEETALYSTVQLKSAALFEFYADNGYSTGFLKYTPELISFSNDISDLNLSINLGNGFIPFNAQNELIEYDRRGDSSVAILAFNFLENGIYKEDTISFYITTTAVVPKKSGGTWDFISNFSNSTSIDFVVGHLRGCGNLTNYAKRPIIIIPPYRPTVQAFSMQKYYDQFNVSDMFTKLAEMGYDIMFIKLLPGNESLELASQAVLEYIALINQNKEIHFPNESWENVVMGYSMGGQIARYALKKMEKEHMDYGAPHHHTRLYVPFDSPHQGANIPMFTQIIYNDLKATNIIAHFAYLSLIDEASKDMSASHIISSTFSIENNGTGQPDIYHITPMSTGARSDFIGDMYSAFNHQFTQPLSDMRRSFPTFTRNIAISTGSNSEDYEDLYALDPGKLLFSQNSFTKLRRVYAAKRISDHTLYRTKERLSFLFPIVIKNRDYRVFYGDEFDMAQGGYKDEFYDKLPTGIIGILQSGALGFGQKHYDNHMCFLPMVSALGINRNIWELGNLKYNLKDEDLMYKKNSDIPLNKSDTYGYPNLGHPADHFTITPFEAIFCDPFTYEHIKMKESQTENEYNADYLDYLTDFIVNEVEAESVFLQNKVIGNNHVQWDPSFTYKAWYKAQNKLTIGNLVTPKTDPGDYIIKASGDITVHAGQEINLKPGFHSQQGSAFHAYIDYACYPDGGKSQQNTQNDSKVSKELIVNEFEISQGKRKTENEHVDISIYPNPSKAEVTVLFPANLEGNFEIANSIGAIIQKNTVPSDYKSILKLESGIYFLHYQSNLGHKLTKQIIIL